MTAGMEGVELEETVAEETVDGVVLPGSAALALGCHLFFGQKRSMCR